jgi:3-hydroxyisobutyrate dehydrogenase
MNRVFPGVLRIFASVEFSPATNLIHSGLRLNGLVNNITELKLGSYYDSGSVSDGEMPAKQPSYGRDAGKQGIVIRCRRSRAGAGCLMSGFSFPRVGFVGLGDQGAPMAERLLQAGFPLTIYARRPEVAARFVALGAQSMPTLSALGASADVVCVVVVDDRQVREVAEGEAGLLAGMRPGSILVVHSTVAPETCRAIGAVAAQRGVTVVDAPVSGGSPRARSGTLTVMVGTDVETFTRVRPVLAAFGSLVRHIGPLGSGQLAKLINNYMFAAHAAVAEQAVGLIRGFGLDEAVMAEVLPTGSGSSTAFVLAAERRFEQPVHDKGLDYAVQVLTKDVRLLQAEADARGVSIELTRQFVERGLGALRGKGSGPCP